MLKKPQKSPFFGKKGVKSVLKVQKMQKSSESTFELEISKKPLFSFVYGAKNRPRWMPEQK